MMRRAARSRGKRIQQAILEISVRRGVRVTYGTFGRDVARAERPPRKPPYAAQTVAAWIEERGEPSLAAFVAMGRITGKSPEWLAFGVRPGIPRGKATER